MRKCTVFKAFLHDRQEIESLLNLWLQKRCIEKPNFGVNIFVLLKTNFFIYGQSQTLTQEKLMLVFITFKFLHVSSE